MSKKPKKYIGADPKAVLKELKKLEKDGMLKQVIHDKTSDRDYIKVRLPIKFGHVIIFQEKDDDTGNYTSIRFVCQWDSSVSNHFDLQKIHDYNANALWGKAYFDDDNDVTLEMMLDLQEPISQKHFHKIYKRWLSISLNFHLKYIDSPMHPITIDDDDMPRSIS